MASIDAAYKVFADFLSRICSHSLVAQNRHLVWTAIANPKAGGFTIRSRWRKHYEHLSACAKKAELNPLRVNTISDVAKLEGGGSPLILTKRQGHAAELCKSLLNEAENAYNKSPQSEHPFYLIITAGGDGTSDEVMTSLYQAPKHIQDNCAVLRLPMGTGNDGSDAWELDTALLLLIEPSVLARQRMLRLRTASGKGPFLAFNILSVGLDAFVTHMTNKTKTTMPGDSYKLWVDIAALFYDRIYKVGFIDVVAKDHTGNEVKAFREKLLLLAVGESGRRTYGSHKMILPDDRNVCAIRQMPLFKKIAFKGHFSHGSHIDKPEAILFNAASLTFSAEHPILAQMDGETVHLTNADFPAVIELTEPVIPILRKSPA